MLLISNKIITLCYYILRYHIMLLNKIKFVNLSSFFHYYKYFSYRDLKIVAEFPKYVSIQEV